MKTIVERAEIILSRKGRIREKIIWETFYFPKHNNLFRLMINGAWLNGAFVSQEKIREAYETYRGQGYAVDVKCIKEINIEVKREVKTVVKPPPKRKRIRRTTLFD